MVTAKENERRHHCRCRHRHRHRRADEKGFGTRAMTFLLIISDSQESRVKMSFTVHRATRITSQESDPDTVSKPYGNLTW